MVRLWAEIGGSISSDIELMDMYVSKYNIRLSRYTLVANTYIINNFANKLTFGR